MGKMQEAKQQWLRAAQGWASDGLWDKATGACRLALTADAGDLDVCHLLNELQRQRQRTVQRTPRQPGSPQEEFTDLVIEGWGDAARRLEPPPPLLSIAVDPLTSNG